MSTPSSADERALDLSEDGAIWQAIFAWHKCSVSYMGTRAAEVDAAISSEFARASLGPAQVPIDMILHCPKCGLQHVDAPDDRTPDWKNEPHRSHLCHGCGCIWRPADVATNGVVAIKTVGKNDSPAGAAQVPSLDPKDAARYRWLRDDATQAQQDAWLVRLPEQADAYADAALAALSQPSQQGQNS